MEEKMDKMQRCIWMSFSAILAVALTVNGVMALFGKGNFAWWHLWTLAISVVMSLESLSPREKARLVVTVNKTTKKAVKFIVVHFRAVRSLPALFRSKIDFETSRYK